MLQPSNIKSVSDPEASRTIEGKVKTIGLQIVEALSQYRTGKSPITLISYCAIYSVTRTKPLLRVITELAVLGVTIYALSV